MRASYTSWISASGFLAVTSAPPSADRIIEMALLSGNQLSMRLDLISYFLWIPALIGLFAYLRERAPGWALIGGAFAAFGVLAFFSAAVLNSASMMIAQGEVTAASKEALSRLFLLGSTTFIPGLWALALSNLLWGMALRSETGMARMVGNLFLVQVAGFIVASFGFAMTNDAIGNTGVAIQILSSAATFAAAGILLNQTAKQESQTKPATEHPRAAAAAAGQ